MASQALYLISVNNTPQRAKELVAILIKEVEDTHDIIHVANTDSPENLEPLLLWLVHKPEILICSSQWTTEQQDEMRIRATRLVPGIKVVPIPPGLNAQKGGEAVVAFLKEEILGLGLPKQN